MTHLVLRECVLQRSRNEAPEVMQLVLHQFVLSFQHIHLRRQLDVDVVDRSNLFLQILDVLLLPLTKQLRRLSVLHESEWINSLIDQKRYAIILKEM